MTIRARATTTIVLRRLAGLLFLTLVGVLSLYLFGREGRPEEAPAAVETPGPEIAILGEGFHFALTDGNRTLFEIEGDEQRSDRTGLVSLTNARIAFQSKNGTYRVEAVNAYYQPETQEARLSGGVKVSGPDGQWIEAPRVEMSSAGERLVAREGVTFGFSNRIVGQASLLEADLETEEFNLSGDVVIERGSEEEGAFRLSTKSLWFNQRGGLARAEGGVFLQSGSSSMSAQRLHVTLDRTTGELTSLRLVGDVEGIFRRPPNDGPIHPVTVRGTSLSVDFDSQSGRPRAFELRGLPSRPASIEQTRDDGSLLSMEAVGAHGSFVDGALSQVRLNGDLLFVARPAEPGSGLRQATASRGQLRFQADGSLGAVTLEGNVHFWDDTIKADGDRAYFGLKDGEVEIFGQPVKITSPRGTLETPQLRYVQHMGLVHGQSGVSAVLTQPSEDTARSTANDQGTIRVVAEETFWLSDPDRVMFQGNVKAWRMTYTLLTEQLRADEAESRLIATRGVRTLWSPLPKDLDLEVDASDSKWVRRRMEISAQEMIADQTLGEITYSGSVRIEQEGSLLRCDNLTLRLDDNDEAEQAYCRGNVYIEDREAGLSLEGSEAIYDFAGERVEVVGDPITMTDAQGTSAGGAQRLTYSFVDRSLVLTAGSSG